jgi:hypothetical protein
LPIVGPCRSRRSDYPTHAKINAVVAECVSGGAIVVKPSIIGDTHLSNEASGDPASSNIRPDRRVMRRKKLVIEIPEELHQRIIAICAIRGTPVNAAVREVLERSFR